MGARSPSRYPSRASRSAPRDRWDEGEIPPDGYSSALRSRTSRVPLACARASKPARSPSMTRVASTRSASVATRASMALGSAAGARSRARCLSAAARRASASSTGPISRKELRYWAPARSRRGEPPRNSTRTGAAVRSVNPLDRASPTNARRRGWSRWSATRTPVSRTKEFSCETVARAPASFERSGHPPTH